MNAGPYQVQEGGATRKTDQTRADNRPLKCSPQVALMLSWCLDAKGGQGLQGKGLCVDVCIFSPAEQKKKEKEAKNAREKQVLKKSS